MAASISVIIAAAGSGRRMGGSIPKQYMSIENLPVLARTVKAFCALKEKCQIVVVCPPGDEAYVRELLAKSGIPGDVAVTAGGATRQESVAKGLALCTGDYVLVHDGARPFVTKDVTEGVLDALKAGAQAAVPGVMPKCTIRTAEKTLDRSLLYEVQTPQGFPRAVLQKAFEKAAEDGFTGTDDAGLAEHAGFKVTVTEGSYANIKITTKEDLPMTVRTGNGYDVHRLVTGRPLMLGCIEIPWDKGLLGHSDADVCAHAIADALLGAAALRDIGYHFPDNSPDTEGMSGAEILSKTAEIVRNAGFTIVNADATIVAQKPRLSPYIEEMRKAVASALEVEVSAISIKATTEEGLGITGSAEAISTFASAALKG